MCRTLILLQICVACSPNSPKIKLFIRINAHKTEWIRSFKINKVTEDKCILLVLQNLQQYYQGLLSLQQYISDNGYITEKS